MTNLQFDLPKDQSSIIKVVGVGGGGSNAVNHMFEQGIIGVNFVIGNTDSQALDNSRVPNKIQLGPKLTQGLGAGSNPDCGALATEESIEEIREILSKNTKMVFVTAGMGGGTGTGGAPVVAKIAREMGILTVGIVTTPFSFEGKRKYKQALEGIEKLKENVDTILVISNDKIREMYGNARQSDAFNHANNILTMAAKSISEIITVPGYINVDFADVKYVMTSGGAAIMGTAAAEGANRAMKAVQGALDSPLLNDNDIRGAKKILVNITSGIDDQVTIDEITQINEYVQEVAKDTDIIFGTCDDPNMGSKLSVTIIATGFEATYKPVYVQPVTKKLLNLDEAIEKPIIPATIVETQVAPVQEPYIITPHSLIFSLDEDTPVISKEENDTTHAELERTVSEVVDSETLIEVDEKSYSLFDMMEMGSKEEPSANVVEFTIPTTLEELHEEIPVADVTPVIAKIEEPIEETVEHIQETTTEVNMGQEKEEEKYAIFNIKSYETTQTEPLSKAALDAELNDRKRILSQMSFRSLNKANVSELENTPAYKRKGIEVAQTVHSAVSDLSRFTVSEDPMSKRPEFKKTNSFLHDKAD